MRRFKCLIALVFAALVVVACSTSPTGRTEIIWKSDAELEAQAAQAFNAMRASAALSTKRAKIAFVACGAPAGREPT